MHPPSTPAAYPEPAGRPGRRRGLVVTLVAVAAVVLLGGAAAVVYLLVSAGGPRTPEETVRAYIQASHQGDCSRMVSVLTIESWSADGTISRSEATAECERTVGALAEAAREAGLRSEVVIDDLRVSGEGDVRTVEVVRHLEYDGALPSFPRPDPDVVGTDEPRQYELRREDGQWRIHVPDGVGLANEHRSWPT